MPYSPPLTPDTLKSLLETMSPLQSSSFAYPKHRPMYVLAFSNSTFQILKGRVEYGGVRDIGGLLRVTNRLYSDIIADILGSLSGSSSDLPAYVDVNERSLIDLSGFIGGHLPIDLPGYLKVFQTGYLDLTAYVKGIGIKNLSGEIDNHLPTDLLSYLKTFNRSSLDLSSYIRGLFLKDLSAIINSVFCSDISSYVYPVTPIDLSAYLKSWPQNDLPSYISGWGQKDLSAHTGVVYPSNINAYIGMHSPLNIRGTIKGIGFGVKDLQSLLTSMNYYDLPSHVRATYFKNLPVTSFEVVAPANLQTFIQGWDIRYLTAEIVSGFGPGDLNASIFGSGGFRDLISFVKPMRGCSVPRNLLATLSGFDFSNISAYISSIEGVNLNASIDIRSGCLNLSAYIRPKTILLTTILPIITMNSSNLWAVINPGCFYSNHFNLTSYLNCVYKYDLGGFLRGMPLDDRTKNLGAKIGYADHYIVVDRIPLNLTITKDYYKSIDKITLILNTYRATSYLGASITGDYVQANLGGYIYSLQLSQFSFDRTRRQEKAMKMTYSGVKEFREDVEFFFRSVVSDYFYVSSLDRTYPINRNEKWALGVQSMTHVFDNSNKLTRKLHRNGILYNLHHYSSIDEATRAVIAFVTDYPKKDLGASIYNLNSNSDDLYGTIRPLYTKNAKTNLSATVTCDSYDTKQPIILS